MKKPVIVGPITWARVLTTLTQPNTAVLSLDGTNVAKKTCLGATSIDWVEALKINIAIVNFNDVGNGTSAKRMDEGKWVTTIVTTGPNRLVNEVLNSEVKLLIIPVIKRQNPNTMPKHQTFPLYSMISMTLILMTKQTNRVQTIMIILSL